MIRPVDKLPDGRWAGSKGYRMRIRAAIKKDVLRQYGIRDLHDLPEKMLPACRLLIDQWSSLAAIREVLGC